MGIFEPRSGELMMQPLKLRKKPFWGKGIKMSARDTKQIIYRYNGDDTSEEIEIDFDGDIVLPQPGENMIRKGKTWKAVQRDIESSGAGAMPIIRLFLTDKF